MGAAITMNADGSFTYDPTASATLRALPQGQSATDTFTYRANDGHGGTGTATVTVTVSGTFHEAPTLSGIESSTLQYDAGTPGRAGHLEPDDQRARRHQPDRRDRVDQLRARLERGCAWVRRTRTGSPAATTPSTGVLTLSGSASVANYQAALRSVTYGDANGTRPDDGAAHDRLPGQRRRGLEQPQQRREPHRQRQPQPARRSRARHRDDGQEHGDRYQRAGQRQRPRRGRPARRLGEHDRDQGHGQHQPRRDDPLRPERPVQQPAAGPDGDRHLHLPVSDGYHDSNSATVTVTITGVNDPPVLSNIESSDAAVRRGNPGGAGHREPHGQLPGHHDAGWRDGDDQLRARRERGFARVHEPERDHRQLQLEHRGADADRQRVGSGLPGGAAVGHLPRRQRPDLDRDTDDQLPGQRWARLEQPQQRRRRGPSRSRPNSPPIAGDVTASTDKHTAIDINVLSERQRPRRRRREPGIGEHDRHHGLGVDQQQRHGPLRP